MDFSTFSIINSYTYTNMHSYAFVPKVYDKNTGSFMKDSIYNLIIINIYIKEKPRLFHHYGRNPRR